MNGERGTFRLCDSPGCSEGSRSVGRSDFHTGAGFFVERQTIRLSQGAREGDATLLQRA